MTLPQFLLLLLLGTACRVPARLPAPTPESAAITWILTRSDSLDSSEGIPRRRPAHILLQATTQPESASVTFLLGGLPRLDSSTAVALSESIRGQGTLAGVPPALPAPAILLSRDSLVARVRRPPTRWSEFLRILNGPSPAVAVSPVFLFPDGQTAAIAVSVTWGGLDGEGRVVLLRHLPEGWVVIASLETWSA